MLSGKELRILKKWIDRKIRLLAFSPRFSSDIDVRTAAVLSSDASTSQPVDWRQTNLIFPTVNYFAVQYVA